MVLLLRTFWIKRLTRMIISDIISVMIIIDPTEEVDDDEEDRGTLPPEE